MEIEPDIEDNVKLFLPAKLFEKVTVLEVHYHNMVSTDITHLKDEKDRLLIFFDRGNHTDKNVFQYNLELDQAVVKINVNDMIKTIKIEDIRVPYYHDKVLIKKNQSE
jgi:hypothetical protein